MKKGLIIAVIVVILVGGAVAYISLRNGNKNNQYRTAPVESGTVVQTIRATGNVEAILQIQVGSQVTGRIIKLYADYNSRVTKNQILAKIDPAPFKERVAQDKANLLGSQAAVEQAVAKLDQAEKELARDRELASRQLLSQSDLDASIANRNVLAAQIKLARSAVEENRAQLRLDNNNLQYTDIISPVDGIVIARNVDEGQTVVASMSAQTIFLIATDLHQIQVEGDVPEADVGKIMTGQHVTFTVDSFPDIMFNGVVSQVRMNATTNQNVVTYPVIVTAENPDEKLKPGMTANLAFEVARKKEALKVPNAALRFKPEVAQQSGAESASTAQASESQTGGGRKTPQSKVWILSANGPTPVPVKAGISDGSFTEIAEGNLKEGDLVITGILEPGEKKDKVTNPFAPSMPGRGSRPPR